jgi:hypothetical protein
MRERRGRPRRGDHLDHLPNWGMSLNITQLPIRDFASTGMPATHPRGEEQRGALAGLDMDVL